MRGYCWNRDPYGGQLHRFYLESQAQIKDACIAQEDSLH